MAKSKQRCEEEVKQQEAEETFKEKNILKLDILLRKRETGGINIKRNMWRR